MSALDREARVCYNNGMTTCQNSETDGRFHFHTADKCWGSYKVSKARALQVAKTTRDNLGQQVTVVRNGQTVEVV